MSQGSGSARSPRRELYYYQQDELQAVRVGPWKLFIPLAEPNRRHPHFDAIDSGRPMLFNVVDDPASQTDLASARPDIVAQLLEVADRARSELGDRARSGSGQRPRGRVEAPQPVTLRR